MDKLGPSRLLFSDPQLVILSQVLVLFVLSQVLVLPSTRKNRKGGGKGKGKRSTGDDPPSTEERSKDQLWETCLRLQEELEGVRKEKHFFQLERDKIQDVWSTSKKNLEESEAQLKDKGRQRSKVQERHRVEINVYKQKLKHVLSEHHNAVSEVKTAAISSSSLLQNQNTKSELGLRGEDWDMQTLSREKQLQEQNSIKKLKLKHQQAMMKLHGEYERRMKEFEMQHLLNIKSLADKKPISTLQEMQKQMNDQLASLDLEHNRKIESLDKKCDHLQKAVLMVNTLKGEVTKHRKESQQCEKHFSTAQHENQRLRKELQDMKLKLAELHRQQQEHMDSREKLEKHQAQQKLVKRELRDLTVEHELQLQAFQKVQQEHDELLRKQTEGIRDIQQCSGLKKILLQKKLDILTETLEKKEAQLSVALSVCDVEPAVRRNALNRLEEILESKRNAMAALQQDLDQKSEEQIQQGAVVNQQRDNYSV